MVDRKRSAQCGTLTGRAETGGESLADKVVYAALDIGNYQIKCVVAELTGSGGFRVLGYATRPSAGIRKGVISDRESTSNAIRDVLSAAERMAGREASTVWVAVSPMYAYLQGARATIPITHLDHRVTPEDVEKVHSAARSIVLPASREVLALWPDEYIVDGYDNLRDPVGMIGNRLSLEARAIIADSDLLADYVAMAKAAGRSLGGYVLKPLALSALMLDVSEQQGDAAIIDMGGGSCEIGYLREGKLRRVGSVPIGGKSVVSDLCLILKVSNAVASRIASELSLLVPPEQDSLIELADFGHVESRQVSRQDLHDIAKARVDEICALVGKELIRLVGKETMLDAVVITGGMLRIPGIDPLLPRLFSRKVRLVIKAKGDVDDSGYNVALGMLTHVARESVGQDDVASDQEERAAGFWARLIEVIKDFWE